MAIVHFAEPNYTAETEGVARDIAASAPGKQASFGNGTSGGFNVRSVKSSGLGGIFNPTNIRMRVKWRDSPTDSSEVALLWRSRDNRKGRNSIAITRRASLEPSVQFPDGPPQFSSRPRQMFQGVLRMFTVFPYWELSYWTALSFNAGSALWTANGLFSWLPVAYPRTEFDGETSYAYGITSLIGVLAYILGAWLAYLEAVNYGSLCGSALRRILEADQTNYQKRLVDEKLQSFLYFGRRTNRKQSTESDNERDTARLLRQRRQSLKIPVDRRGAIDVGSAQDSTRGGYNTFRFFPTWQNFKESHIREIGFLACSIQFIGAALFFIPGIVSLPGVENDMSQWQENAAYWIPSIVASAFFIPSSTLFILETQEKWYLPKYRILGWWIGLFALIGSCGFLIDSALGPAAYGPHHRVEYQSSLSCLWASMAFWISSLLQQYEACNRNVVEELHESADGTLPEVHPV